MGFLLLVVLLLVITPALLYGIARATHDVFEHPPQWLGFPVERASPRRHPTIEQDSRNEP